MWVKIKPTAFTMISMGQRFLIIALSVLTI
ncbi:hypothetical protein [Symbiopectobacterium sp. RP]